jgi:Domain of Unknown Function (DUF350)
VAYLLVYTRITPHNEFELIRNNDPKAAIGLGPSLLGFTLPVGSAIAHAANVLPDLEPDRADRPDRGSQRASWRRRSGWRCRRSRRAR